MQTKEKLIELLEEADGEFLSGAVIAERLHMTRAGVWKHIKSLESEGYRIEGIHRRGYRLLPECDMVNAPALRRALNGDVRFHCEVYDTVGSTNRLLKEKAAEESEWTVILAGAQSAGRGRLGRSFYSPKGSGIYFSVLLRPQMSAEQASRLTTLAALAVCHAIEDCTGQKAQIKWVNDVYLHGRKVCGILTEASVNMEQGQPEWAVVGVGLNVYEPDGGFPEELRGIAGAISEERKRNLRVSLAAAFLRHFRRLYEEFPNGSYAEEYRAWNLVPGKSVTVHRGDTQREALALSIDDECRLVVRYEDGTEEALSSGEISIRPTEGEWE